MKKFLSLILALSFFLNPLLSPTVHADEGELSEELHDAVEQSVLLLQLKQKLAQIQYRYTLLQANVETAKDSLIEMEAAIQNLERVVKSLDAQIEDNKHQTTSVKTQKERRKMDIEALEEDVQILQMQLEDQKKVVGELMTLIYVKREVYYDRSGVDPVKVLASEFSVSETLQKLTYLNLIEDENQSQILKLEALQSDLSEKWSELRQRKAELENLDLELADDLVRLQTERDLQQAILTETKEEKVMLETMLSSSDEREEDLLHEIEIYKRNVEDMETKLSSMKDTLSTEQQNLVLQIQAEMSEHFDESEIAQTLDLDWPVPPKQGISAFFHDPGYINAFGVDHFALDLPTHQGTAIQAPADGVVTAVIFDENSTKYAYIQIAHRMGVMTIFGHISSPNVHAGDYVMRGDIIGYTGGMPGTPGSGARTTGPHLHFEVWQDGVHVDPLHYLPLDDLDMDSLPEEYLNQVQGALEDQIREITEQLGL